jgi:hypothetical protein
VKNQKTVERGKRDNQVIVPIIKNRFGRILVGFHFVYCEICARKEFAAISEKLRNPEVIEIEIQAIEKISEEEATKKGVHFYEDQCDGKGCNKSPYCLLSLYRMHRKSENAKRGLEK